MNYKGLRKVSGTDYLLQCQFIYLFIYLFFQCQLFLWSLSYYYLWLIFLKIFCVNGIEFPYQPNYCVRDALFKHIIVNVCTISDIGLFFSFFPPVNVLVFFKTYILNNLKTVTQRMKFNKISNYFVRLKTYSKCSAWSFKTVTFS